jgi:hypothetical protein
MNKIYEYIVVGTGPTGAQATQTLIEAGAEVLVLDVAVKPDTKKLDSIPNKDYLKIRRDDASQRRYFLGENYEGITWGPIKTTTQLTPLRQYLSAKTQEWVPIISQNFNLVESLAYGGLSVGWGLGAQTYTPEELSGIGLDAEQMREAYKVIGDRIGISAGKDDVTPIAMSEYSDVQPAVKMDANMQSLLNKYNKRKNGLNKSNIYLGRTPLALLTKDLKKRKAYSYRGMDFYDDKGLSGYRAWMTMDELKGSKNLTFLSSKLVVKFSEQSDAVTVEVVDVETKKQEVYKARKLILACNVAGTARIVIRSFGDYGVRLPLLSDPYIYIPGINLSMLGRQGSELGTDLSQLVMYYAPEGLQSGTTMASLYGYRQLMQFKLTKEFPLDFNSGRILAQLLQPAFVLAGIHHEDYPSKDKYMQLKKDPKALLGDKLHVSYKVDKEQQQRMQNAERHIGAALRRLGVLTLGTVDPGYGASIHYVGTLPFSEKEEKYHVLPDGRLSKTKHVYIADGSGFKYLPAKGLTFTLMANAHNVALNTLKSK